MNPTTAATPYQPAQHWQWSSLATINDGAFSTPMAALASSTTSPTTTTGSSKVTTTGASGAVSTASGGSAVPGSSTATPTSDSSASNSSQKSSGLSAGAGAGIGVGIAIVVMAAIAGLILLILRRRRNKKIPNNATEMDAPTDGHQNWPVYAKETPKEVSGQPVTHEMYAPPAELAGNEGPHYQSPGYHQPGKR
ncbi:hypothetical protein EG328_001331 [Venturia inaequalis]|uniref:Mid2 domain-containing protein n=1 Tax=Venturia inaequalis TaxID=5025 RepID=A0A8H3VJ93_VENIN|nr:hypothetical protein EG328_001331 [Venturia inaequalis]